MNISFMFFFRIKSHPRHHMFQMLKKHLQDEKITMNDIVEYCIAYFMKSFIC